MTGRTWSRAAMLALAIAMPVAPIVATSATASPGSVASVVSHPNDGGTGHAGKDVGQDSGKQKPGKNAHAKFNLGGRITAVDALAGTVTFRVHGGKFKALRGTELTVSVADGARVRRNHSAATLADFQIGDKVRAKGVQLDGVWTAKRIQAEAPGSPDSGGGSGNDSSGT
ncbi:MAG: hypothetical protein QOF53_1366 [Nocardioidaceae bacterium]|nr:hypothetical protein [Nocardioidaceae bacterium]